MPKSKYYVVWNGLNPGVYDNWLDCKCQIQGYANAKYKSFDSEQEAQNALLEGYEHYFNRPKSVSRDILSDSNDEQPILNSLAVDAACSGNPGDMEYKGVYTATGTEVFHVGPLKKGTNNIGEFLAIVHALALLKKNGSNLPIYTDSRNAMLWVKKKKCSTKLEQLPENRPIFDLIRRAEIWLKTNTYSTEIYKWETKKWGEIPADFGRK